MKKGRLMKKGRRYDEGGDIPDRVYAEDAGITGRGNEKAEDQYRDSTGEGADTYAEPQKSVKTESAPNEGPQGKLEDLKTPDRSRKPAAKTAKPATFQPRGQLKRLREKSAALTDKQKEEAGKRTGMALASFAAGPVAGRIGQGLMSAHRVRQAREAMKAGEATPRGWEKMSLSERAKATGGYKKGGMMKESKAMVGKEVAFMKKKGAPASMIKHEKAEMSAMKKGGMAKYARGGGIESRGKTKGTIVKMAAGGLASGHKAADGIAQRGKTKGMKVSMKGGGYC